MNQLPNIEEESREAYAERYLLGRIFEIVQHYDKSAVANPPVVRKAVEDIIATLVTPHHQELQKAREEVYKEVQANAEQCYRDNRRGAFEPVRAVPLYKLFTN